MKRINAKLFADMWLSEAITDEQRELAARVAKSAMEFPEDKTHIDKFIEKRLEETTGPEHYYLEKLVKDYKEMQINAIDLTQYDDPYLVRKRWQRGQKEDSPEFLAKWIGELYREESNETD